MRNWVVFEGRPNIRDRDKIRVTINEKNNLLLNNAAFEALGRPKQVELCYDRKFGVIGVRPILTKPRNAFPLVPRLKGTYQQINASPFCKHFNIEIDGTQLFTEPRLDKTGILELDLALTQPAGRGSR